jgi:hypothetical protein
VKILLKILFLILLFKLAACKTYVPVSHTEHRSDTTIIREKLVPVKVPGSSVATHIGKDQYDSLVRALMNLPRTSRTIYITDPTLQTQLKIYIDSLGQLAFKCQTLEREYQAKLQEKERTITTTTETVVEKEETLGQKLERFLRNGLIWAVIAIIICAVLILKK